MSGYEFHSEAGLRTWITYRPGGVEERSTTAWRDVTPSFREATLLVVKTLPPAVVVMRIS
jgi:hypothetical protein